MKALLAIAATLLLLCGCTTTGKTTKTSSLSIASDPVSMAAAQAYASGDDYKSLELYLSLVEQDPENHVYINNLGVLLLKSGRSNEALEAFQRASLLAPDKADYLINTGLAHIKLTNYEESLVFFDRALQQSPNAPEATYGKGTAYLYLEEPEIALGLFRRAVAEDPFNPKSRFMKAYAEQKNGLWRDAISDFTAYIDAAQDPIQKANAYSNRALCHFELDNYDEGMVDLDMAMELNDSSPIYYYNRAQGLQEQQKFEDAIKDYTRAISHKAGFPEAYINRGEMHYILGNKSKGCSDLKRACDLGFCGPLETYETSGKCSE